MKRLKVLLLKPYSRSDEVIPPLGLGYLATAIREKHDVEILDGDKERLTPEKFKKELKIKQYNIIGIQMFTFQVALVKKYIRFIKKILPEAKIILGGPHPSCSPLGIFRFFPEADWVFKGEAEIGLANLLDLVAIDNNPSREKLAGVIPGLIWRDNGQVVANPPVFVENLDSLGMPAWDLLRPDTYPLSPHGGFFKNYPVAPIVTTRGCPFNCTFCAGHLITGKKIRFRSPENIMEEIRLLHDQYGIREIHIEDDNFTFNKNFVKEFCAELKKSNLGISWTCPNGVRLDTLDEELILIMKDAGLYGISVGIESGSDRILQHMKKGITKEQISEKINLIKRCGLSVSGFFILGYPTENKEDILATINFAIELGLQRAGFSLFKPFPGTEITKMLIEKGELKQMSNEDWARFVLADAVYAPLGFTKQQMKKIRREALLRFYLRPAIAANFIRDIKNWKHLKVILARIYSWLFRAK